MYKNTFSSNLKEMRKQKGMTQAQLAHLLNISVMTVRRLEAGTRVPKLKTIEDIAKILEVDPMELTYGEDVYKNTAGELIKKEGLCLKLDNIPGKGKLVEAIDKAANSTDISVNCDFDYKKSNEQIRLKKDTIAKYDSLNTLGQKTANKLITALADDEEYTKPDNED